MMNKLFSRIKAFAKPSVKEFSEIEKLVGFQAKNLSLYELAMIHGSASVVDKAGHHMNNERLEFLGDAIIEATVTDYLYRYFPTKQEGFLSTVRSKIVQRETLNRVALDMGIKDYLITAQNVQTHNIYGNALEALVGAVYLDQGYQRAKEFVQNQIVQKHINVDKLAQSEVNYKSKLIEWCQKQGKTLSFEVIEQTQNGSETFFRVAALINDVEVGRGGGPNKIKAEQYACKHGLSFVSRYPDVTR